MKRTKTEKGITLIALIITVIILLILAVVAIGAVQNDGIIQHAKNARDEYQDAQVNEQTALNGYLAELDENNPNAPGKWKQNGTVVTDGTTTLSVGDYVEYAIGAVIRGWRVLGAENGQILLISEDIVGTQELRGVTGYNTGVNTLDTVCAPYGKGEYATGARSVKIEDINRITGYNPDATNDDGGKFMAGTAIEYGKEITYTLTDEGVAFTDKGSISGTSIETKFIHPDGRVLMSNDMWNNFTDEEKVGLTRVNSIPVRNSAYMYDPSSLKCPSDFKSTGFSEDNEAFKMLFGTNYATAEEVVPTSYTSKKGNAQKLLNTTDNVKIQKVDLTYGYDVYTGENMYWLASQFESTMYDQAEGIAGAYGIFCVLEGLVNPGILCSSNSNSVTEEAGVRPVVYLKPDVTLYDKERTSKGVQIWSFTDPRE